LAAIRVGVQLQPQQCSFTEYRAAWLRFDELGVDSLWDWDHFFPLYGNRNGAHFEGWTTLAIMAAQTRRATVGCLVLAMSYRNPALLSAMATTLDHATDGRLILGLGAGWAARDYREYGYGFGTAGTRLKNLERGIENIKDRWTKDNSRPLRGRVPIMIGGGGEKVTLRIAAQHADLWNSFGPAGRWSHKNRVLDDWCARVERDPAAIERTVSIDPSGVDRLDELVEVGAQHIICELGAPFDPQPIERLLAWRDRQR